MVRLLLYAALLIIAVLVLMRMLPPGRGRRGKPRRPIASGPAPDTVVCAECGTRYSPAREGWSCPSCGT